MKLLPLLVLSGVVFFIEDCLTSILYIMKTKINIVQSIIFSWVAGMFFMLQPLQSKGQTPPQLRIEGSDDTVAVFSYCWNKALPIMNCIYAGKAMTSTTIYIYTRNWVNGNWGNWLVRDHLNYKNNVTDTLAIKGISGGNITVGGFFNYGYGTVTPTMSAPPPNTLPYIDTLRKQFIISTGSVPDNPFANGAVTSNSITIRITPIPWLLSQPTANNTLRCRDGSAIDTFRIKDTLPTLYNNSYQWYRATSKAAAPNTSNATLIIGATGKSYAPITSTLVAGSYYYFCAVSNRWGCAVNSNWIGGVTTQDTIKRTVYQYICNGKQIWWNNIKISDTGTYIAHLQSVVTGCDSMVKGIFSKISSPQKTIYDSVCRNKLPYLWLGKLYSVAGRYRDTIKTSTACDTIVTLNLFIKDTSYSNSKKTVCRNALPYVWNGINCTATRLYSKVFANAKGCDSVAYLDFTVKDTSSSVNYKSICAKQLPYTWNGKVFTASGTQTATLVNKVGCDSVATLHLTVKPNSYTVYYDTACRQALDSLGWAGYFFVDTTLKQNGTCIRVVDTNAVGCDSIVELRLTVYNSSYTDTSVYVCGSCSYTVWGNTYTQTGVHRAYFTNEHGCDSTVVLHLYVGQIAGDSAICLSDTASFSVINNAGFAYYWAANNGNLLLNNPNNNMAAWFNSAGKTYVTVTAIDTIQNKIMYRDTMWVWVDTGHIPALATTGGMLCQKLVDTLINELTGDTTYQFNTYECVNVCENMRSKYYAIGKAGSYYNWRVTGGTIIAQGADSVVVVWGNYGMPAEIWLTENTALGCADSVRYCFEILKSPVANIHTIEGKLDTLVVCKAQQVLLIDNSNQWLVWTNSYVWNFDDGTVLPYSQPTNVTHLFTTAGYHTVTLSLTSTCGCVNIDTLVVFVKDSAGVKIICERTVCENSTQYYSLDIPNITSCSLDSGWSVQGGSIIQNNGNNIVVKWDSVGSNGVGTISYDTKYCPYLCPGKSSIQIGVIKTSGVVIQGDSVICSHNGTLYKIPFWNNTSYSWSVTGGAVLFKTPNPNEVYVSATGTSSTIKLSCHYNHNIDSCAGDVEKDITVLGITSITGSSKVCVNDTAIIVASNTNGSNWQWEVTKPDLSKDIIAGTDTLHYVALQSGSYVFNTLGTGKCGVNKFTLVANALPATPIIQGKDSVCATELYTYKVANAQANMSYVWQVLGQTSIVGSNTGNSINTQHTGSINLNIPFVASIVVQAQSSAGCSSGYDTLPLHRLKINNNLVGFTGVACPNSRSTYQASYTEGDEYTWSILPAGAGSIESGNGTSAIQVLWNNNITGNVTIRLRIRKCGVASYFSKDYVLSITPAPTISISAANSVCRGNNMYFNLYGVVSNSLINLTGASVVWNFGDGSTVGGGSYTGHLFNPVTTTPIQDTVTATLVGLHYGGCVLNNVNVTASTIITINPTPKYSASSFKVSTCSTAIVGLHTQDTSFLIINPNYGSATDIIWTTNGNATHCTAPFNNNCFYFAPAGLAADTSNYTITVGNSYGCSETKNIEIQHFDCPPPECIYYDSLKPAITIIGDTIVHCGLTNLTAQTSFATGHWWTVFDTTKNNIPGYTVTNTTVSTYVVQIPNIGKYEIDFRAYYTQVQGNDTVVCHRDRTLSIVVPIVPEVTHTIKCVGNAYQLTMGEYTQYLSGVSNVVYDYYIDGTMVHSSGNNKYITSLADTAAHNLQIIVHYSYASNNYSCSTAVKTTAVLPALPTAHFTISPNHCEGIPIQFTYSGNYDFAHYTYYWDFGDNTSSLVQDPARVYEYKSGNPTSKATLTVSNGYCTVKDSVSLTIIANNLDIGINWGDYIICPNTSKLIYYTNLMSGSTPSTFNWYDARSTSLQVPVAITTAGSYNITSSGSYWLKIYDTAGCYKALDGNATVVVAPVEIPVIVSSPAPQQTDTLDVCENNTFTLTATLHNTTNVLNYDWYQDGTVILGAGTGSGASLVNSITIAANTLTVGNVYAYTVVTDNDVNNGQLCSVTTRTFYVRINAAPTTPTIDPPMALDCRNYTIGLTASSNTPGIFSWSTGYSSVPNVTQSSTTVNRGGIYIVTITSGLQCSSSDTVRVPSSAKEYFGNLANGCYKICLPDSGKTFPLNSPSPVFAYWNWLLNWQPYMGGFNSPVQPLTVLSSGTYSLVANNGLCTDTAFNAVLEISQPNNCDGKDQFCGFTVVANNVYWGATHDTVYIDFKIDNLNKAPIPFTITTGTSGSTTTGGIAAANGTTYFTAIYVMPAGGAGSTDFTFTFHYTLNKTPMQCERIVDVCLDDCLPLARQLLVNSSKIVSPAVHSNLWVYPSVANHSVTIQYNNNATTNNKQQQLNIYNAMGERVATYKVSNKGQLQLEVGNWANGLYLVQLVGNNKVLQTEKMVVNH